MADTQSFLADMRRRLRPVVCPFDPVLEQIPRGSSVFDIGCGTGFFLDLVARSREPRRLGGCDVSPGLLAAARSTLSQGADGIELSLIQSEGGVPTSAADYEVVTLIDVLHHIPPRQQEAWLSELVERMGPGSIFILKDIDAGRPCLCAMNKLHDALFGGGAGHEWTRRRAEHHLNEAGLSIVASGAQRKIWYPHYWIVGRKG